MINYTTPSIPLLVKGIDLTDGYDVYVTLEQENIELTKSGQDISMVKKTNDTEVTIVLTQEESAMFRWNASVTVMVNFIDSDGVRDAAGPASISVMRNLLDKVIKYGD